MNLLAIFFVAFLNKGPQSHLALSPRALQQRAQWTIPVDSLDYGVNPVYLDSLQQCGAQVLHTSRWMNGATCQMTDSLAQVVRNWSFIDYMECTRLTDAPLTHSITYPAEGTLPDRAFPLMAICDVGFTNFDTLSCFDHSHYLGGFDLTDIGDSFYKSGYNHGTQCLSIIAGQNGNFKGAYTDAYYYLMRSEEEAIESPKEADNLIAAIELADSLGVNIFSASLGYYTFNDSTWNYSYSMLDGRTTRCSRAASIAARKGMLLCVAAGNEGNKAWHYLMVPSDADSILCVGAVDSLGMVASFSSRGPAADGRIKPDICEWGQQAPLLSPTGAEIRGNGTSYATPLAAGRAAQAWSQMPGLTAQELRQRILQSANHYTNPDADYGYGIPNWQLVLTPTGVDETKVNTKVNDMKLFWNGQVVIMHNGHCYDILGRPIANGN